ncbi:hypothetical protein IV102_24220 [bacterium]|nr:hypothetical protein [bacterium]
MSEERIRAWLELASRHLAMARLLRPDHPDGAFFHVYHGFECALTAQLIRLAPTEGIPVGHRDKVDLFLDRVADQLLEDRVSALWPRLDRRNEALYIGWRGTRLRKPDALFTAAQVGPLLHEIEELLEILS